MNPENNTLKHYTVVFEFVKTKQIEWTWRSWSRVLISRSVNSWLVCNCNLITHPANPSQLQVLWCEFLYFSRSCLETNYFGVPDWIHPSSCTGMAFHLDAEALQVSLFDLRDDILCPIVIIFHLQLTRFLSRVVIRAPQAA